MTNQLTVDQLEELLQIQKDFDSRIPTLNLQDSKIAYVVEFFEWFNTLETFKNWKKKPGKPLEVQLDELADMLAFGLSIANQTKVVFDDEEMEYIHIFLNNIKQDANNLKDILYFYAIYEDLGELLVKEEFSNRDSLTYMLMPISLAYDYYTIDQLIDAYKKKMERNHARQDGTADQEKGYV